MRHACEPKDLAAKRVGVVLWGVPAIALGVGAFLGSTPRALVWTGAFLVAGISCIVNAARCGRLHCYVTGPLYLFGAGMTMLGVVRGVRIETAWVFAAVIVGTAAAYAVEWRGRYTE